MAAVVGVQHHEAGPGQRVLLAGQALAGHVDLRLDVAVVEHDARERARALRPDQDAGHGELVAAVGDLLAGVGVGLVLGAQDPGLAAAGRLSRISAGSDSRVVTSGGGSSVRRRCRWSARASALGRACSRPPSGWQLARDLPPARPASLRAAGRQHQHDEDGGDAAHTGCTDDQASGFVSPWIRPSVDAERLAAAAPAAGDDLGRDADRGLLRGAGAEVEADRAGEPARARPRSARPR